MIIDELLKEWEQRGEIANVKRVSLYETEYTEDYYSVNFKKKKKPKRPIINYLKGEKH